MALNEKDFVRFFRAVYGYEPFPWQRMLAERVMAEGWPECLDVPTASGKTGCLDIAVFALASQAERPLDERTAARRIFFVVDRRIVVDSAFQRAAALAEKLSKAQDGILKEVADRLRSIHGDGEPLVAARIRGGLSRNDGWIRSPAQPTIVTGTVDQVGSRLLFRGYGPSRLSASVHAALIANDSLLILDEAHCAVPFFQTVKAVERFRGPEWSKAAFPAPLRVVVMSATPPEGVRGVFPSAGERTAALDHEKLRQRRKPKPAVVAVAKKPRPPRRDEAGFRGTPLIDDEFVFDAADRSIRLCAAGRQRVAVMVNRVATARAIYRQLRSEPDLNADIILLTGRMRPLDRDDLLERWQPALQAREDQAPLDRPIIVVTTQCLEVGADFSFDALITECASLDALRQRFGRLDRFGTSTGAVGCVLIRGNQVRTEEQLKKLEREGKPALDPIYGNALARTWNWLSAHAVRSDAKSESRIDLGIDSVDMLLPADQYERRTLVVELSARAPDAPVMLPSHVDCWVQTSPRPTPDPEPAIFLHGPSGGQPEVSVVIRADLEDDVPKKKWTDTVSICPPTSLEAFPVPLRMLHRLMTGSADTDESGDVEGSEIEENSSNRQRGTFPVLLWRGRRRGSNRTVITDDPDDIRPNDIVVVPAGRRAVLDLVDVPRISQTPPLDLGDRAFLLARRRPMLRVHPRVLEPWSDHPAVKRLLEWFRSADRDERVTDLSDVLRDMAAATEPLQTEDGEIVAPLPEWMRDCARALRRDRKRELLGYALTSRVRVTDAPSEGAEDDAFADEDDLPSKSGEAVALQEHLQAVANVARDFARCCLPAPLVPVVERSATLHDIGKLDWRFQVLLNNGSEIEAFRRPRPLAKSEDMPQSMDARRRARALADLPEGFRHELVSVQLLEIAGDLAPGSDRDLLLHLIASHHGYARPLPPVIVDEAPPDIDLAEVGLAGSISTQSRLDALPLHRLDSGVSARFWRLTREFGWWGLAYIEAVLRLADWEASARHEQALARAEDATAEGVA